MVQRQNKAEFPGIYPLMRISAGQTSLLAGACVPFTEHLVWPASNVLDTQKILFNFVSNSTKRVSLFPFHRERESEQQRLSALPEVI